MIVAIADDQFVRQLVDSTLLSADDVAAWITEPYSLGA